MNIRYTVTQMTVTKREILKTTSGIASTMLATEEKDNCDFVMCFPYDERALLNCALRIIIQTPRPRYISNNRGNRCAVLLYTNTIL